MLRFMLACAIALALIAEFRAPIRAAAMTTVPATATTPAIPVYIARPDGAGPFPAVLLLHGCSGVDGFLAVAADRLAMHGIVGVALDALTPHGLRTACNGTSDGDQVGAARATLAWLRGQSYVAADRLGVVGFSMGGNTTLALIDTPGTSAPRGLRVAVTYYPSCTGRDGQVSVPLAIFDGDADTITPAAPCATMTQAATTAGKPVTLTTYPGATHGFDVPGPDRLFYNVPIRYDATAAADAARKTYEFLVRYLES